MPIDATEPTEERTLDTLAGYIRETRTQMNTVESSLGDHEAETTDAHDASAISNVAAGGIVATDVQSAINELDSEKYDKTGGTVSGNVNVTGNITLTGTVDGRDVAADGTKLDGIEPGAGGDQNASEVPFTPAGSVAATDVQAAIEEVDNEKVAKSGGTMTGDLTVPNLITDGNVDGRDVSVDGAKLDGIEPGAKDDQTAAEVSYSNATSGLTATDVQAAIDEVQNNVEGIVSMSNIEVFTSSGTFNVPAGVSKVFVECWGGGGGGSGYEGSSGQGSGGGGSAAYCNGFVTVTPSGTVNVTVGAGGAGGVNGTAGSQAGSDGGDSSFGANMTAEGGKGGVIRSAVTSGPTYSGSDVDFGIDGINEEKIVSGTYGVNGSDAPRGGRGGCGGYNTTRTAAQKVGGAPGGGGGSGNSGSTDGGDGGDGRVIVRY